MFVLRNYFEENFRQTQRDTKAAQLRFHWDLAFDKARLFDQSDAEWFQGQPLRPKRVQTQIED